MKSIYTDIKRRGGIAATHELLADGHTSRSLTAAVRRGDIIRIRQGHYGCPELSLPEQQAVRVGGRLTGLAGARHYGIWAPRSDELEISVRPDSRALRTRVDSTKRLSDARKPTLTRATWRDHGARGTRAVLLPAHCVEEIARSHDDIVAFASAESALNSGHMTLSELKRTIASLPSSRRGRLHLARRASESGGESLFRFRALDLAMGMRQQVRFHRIGRIDFLLGERLVVEIDGAEFHASREAFEEDRRRDALLTARGYRVLRFSYIQVESRWPEVQAALDAAIARGDHLA